jgi:hypothetical protein
MKNQTEVLRYPRLDTILMVEDAIKNCDEEMTLTQLWNALPKKVMYQTFKVIITYLLDSGKIIIHNKLIIWTYGPETIERLEKQNLIIR